MTNPSTLLFGEGRTGLPDCRPKPLCDPRPVCPACGGLECLCRPRFFAGQLLTEEDLNRLDHYIVAKNRLHNRHLFGSGVACGLEVVCGPRPGTVVVKSGYALSPCGNDIVVCRDEQVDICELIDRCRPRRDDDCFQPVDRGTIVEPTHDPTGIPVGAPPHDSEPELHDQDDDEWVLAVCYRETPNRGITALRGAACSCGGHGGHSEHRAQGGCGCGGGATVRTTSTVGQASGCGCGGGGGGTATMTTRMRPAARPGPTPAHCEPTLTCEGYTFAVYKTPPEHVRQRELPALFRRFLCCFLPLYERMRQYPGNDVEAGEKWLRDHHAALHDFLVNEGLYDCDISQHLAKLAIPARMDDANLYTRELQRSALRLAELFTLVFRKCLCSAFLPPCPPPEMNDCVPIATVSVARGSCRVRHVCNVDSRRFLVTWPSVQYWVSWLPFFHAWNPGDVTLRSALEKACCEPIARKFDFRNVDAVRMHARSSEAEPITASGFTGIREGGAMHPLMELLMESLRPGPRANPATVLLAALGARSADDSPLASDVARAHPTQAMLMDQIIGPLLGQLLGDRPARVTEDSWVRRELDKMKAEIEDLKRPDR